jgi:hypothetical protein
LNENHEESSVSFHGISSFRFGLRQGAQTNDDYFVEFATLLKEGSSIRFQLDNGQLLTPESNDNIKGRIDNG